MVSEGVPGATFSTKKTACNRRVFHAKYRAPEDTFIRSFDLEDRSRHDLNVQIAAFAKNVHVYLQLLEVGAYLER